jgi:hypothetical protein
MGRTLAGWVSGTVSATGSSPSRRDYVRTAAAWTSCRARSADVPAAAKARYAEAERPRVGLLALERAVRRSRRYGAPDGTSRTSPALSVYSPFSSRRVRPCRHERRGMRPSRSLVSPRLPSPCRRRVWNSGPPFTVARGGKSSSFVMMAAPMLEAYSRMALSEADVRSKTTTCSATCPQASIRRASAGGSCASTRPRPQGGRERP